MTANDDERIRELTSDCRRLLENLGNRVAQWRDGGFRRCGRRAAETTSRRRSIGSTRARIPYQLTLAGFVAGPRQMPDLIESQVALAKHRIATTCTQVMSGIRDRVLMDRMTRWCRRTIKSEDQMYCLQICTGARGSQI
jgi:hypothetical protein